MNIRAIAFTEKGQGWQEKLGFPVTRGVPVMQWAREAFADADALLFIGACGIAVRAIAPLCRDKAADPAVLVMEGTAIVIEKVQDLGRLDFSRNICLFSQTTKSLDGFREVVAEVRRRIADGVQFEYFDTICRQVANRLPNIKAFASKHDWVYFVAGKKSSNGKMLLEECRKANPNTVFISEVKEITEPLPEDVGSVGVCGATSTPKWLMEEVAVRIRELNASR